MKLLLRALLRDAWAPAAWTFASISCLAAVMAGVQALWAESVVVGPLTWLGVVGLALPSIWPIALPAAAAVGVCAALARWVEEGAWIGLRTAGISGRQLATGAALVGLIGALGTASCTLALDPMARRSSSRMIAAATADVSLWPGQTLNLGPVSVRARRIGEDGWAEDLFLTGEGAVGTARRGRVVQLAEGPGMDLREGLWLIEGPPVRRLEYGRWLRPLPPARSPRLELDQRSLTELATVARRTERSGRDASYEWAILYKRFLHPLSALLLPLGLLPWAMRRRWPAAVATACVGYLVAVRVGDHLAPAVGPLASASAGPLLLLLGTLLSWASWRER